MKKVTLYIAILLLIAGIGTTDNVPSLSNDLAQLKSASHSLISSVKQVTACISIM